ncbi:MAG: hypothetical protein IPJ06_00495 [Saprospiraceae bacterium]|nr:hypothetical protein [Saprospiraceae bacterium]
MGAFILVGGPTHSPILRNMLREQITENLDLSVDPMTVVAQGAALYASTISIDANIIELERDKLKVQLDLKYEATTVEKEEMVSIRILPDKMDGVLPEIFMVDLHRLPEGFKTGQKQINDKPCLIDVLLESNCPNEFEILAFDGMGNRLECEPNRFTILQGVGGVSSMQVLPYHIGIVKYYSAQEKELFSPVKGLEKSKPIKSGLTGVADGLKTQKDIRPGSAEDMIRIPIYQGDYHSEGTNPDLNFHVSDAVLSGESFPKVLSSGSPVNLRIKVDASGLMTVIAEFPTIEHEEMVKIEIQQSNPPTQDELRGKVKLSLGVAKELADQTISDRLLRLSGEIDDIGTSADGRLRLMDEYRKILLELDDLEKKTEWPKLEQAMKESFYELEELVERIVVNGDDEKLNMDKVEAYIIDLRQKIEHAISEQDTRLAKELTKEVGQLDFDLRNAVTGNAMDAQLLRHIDESFGDYHWKNATKARQLVNQGLQMAANGQTSAIRPLIIELIALLPDDEKSDLLVG